MRDNCFGLADIDLAANASWLFTGPPDVMRILFLNHNVARKGGTFFRAFHTGRYLAILGHQVTLLTISADRRIGFEREMSEGVEIIHTPDLLWGLGRTGWDIWDTVSRILYLRKRTWDVVHAWDCRPVVIYPALAARRQSRSVGGKLIIDWCDWWGRGGTQAERPASVVRSLYSPVETFFEEAFRTKADGTTVASAPLRERVMALGVPGDNIMMLPGGSDTVTINVVEQQQARAKIKAPAGDWIVGYLGALPEKEVDLLAATINKLRAKLPRVRLLAIGVRVAGSRTSFRDCFGNSWGDWITETGRISFGDVSTYLGACDALILPMRNTLSNHARWPSKINDYLAAGRPIVATRIGEVVPLLEKYGAGLLAEDDPDALSRALFSIAHDPGLAKGYAAKARMLAEGELNWTTLVGRLNDYYFGLRKA